MANFEIPEHLEFIKELRRFETTDRAHADIFNAVVQVLLNNEVYLFRKMAGLGKVKIGPADTQLETGDTLFIIDGNLPGKFEAAAYSNVMFSVSSPEYADYWARMPPGEEPGQAAEGTANVPVTIGEIVVSQEAPEDAAFFAKITP